MPIDTYCFICHKRDYIYIYIARNVKKEGNYLSEKEKQIKQHGKNISLTNIF